ncbi:SF3 helicase domain-containing protein [Caerostris extrusa]|uniref:SF3 helicase domain-containing protein n=1 Tax=Caerostris extrusa TaxID=172846 RepID=A0AAV4TVT1_CAEEX|nr:SF3 helicase domain-containing protein [Caerostris extrusa]
MYEQNVGGIPTAKVFSTTNKLPECQATQAFQDRVIALPFNAKFSDQAPLITSEQVKMNMYPKDAYVIEQSYEGCFLMLYYHLQTFMTLEDGLLHYREEPDSVKEYTQDYLANTDVYMQFKLYMDIQINSECMTTMNDLRSAVRQFLKAMKNLSTPKRN